MNHFILIGPDSPKSDKDILQITHRIWVPQIMPGDELFQPMLNRKIGEIESMNGKSRTMPNSSCEWTEKEEVSMAFFLLITYWAQSFCGDTPSMLIKKGW